MLTIVCVYWKGFFKGIKDKYDPLYVTKLYNMLGRNISVPFNFVCLTNDDKMNLGYDTVKLTDNLPGWWNKIEVFKPNLFSGRVLYIDLDVLILNNIDCFVEYPSSFGILETMIDFEKGYEVPREDLRKGKAFIQRHGLMEVYKFNSSVMVWDVSELSESIYNKFNPEMINFYRGDQDYLGDHFSWLSTFPFGWVKKFGLNCNRNDFKDNKVVLCMPTKNRELVNEYEWVKEIWI